MRLLVCGHANSATGFARVLHSLLHHLPDGYEIHHLGSNVAPANALGTATGQLHAALDPIAASPSLAAVKPPSGIRRWPVYANPRTDQAQAQDELRNLVAQVQPHVLLILDEPWAAAVYRPLLKDLPNSCRSVLYAAIDGADACTAQHLEEIQDFNSLVLFNQFGRSVVERSARSLDSGTQLPALKVIPHGIDSSVFHPLRSDDEDSFAAARAAARQQLFGDAVGPDTFIVLNANRNQPNKRIDLTVEGFARFADNKPPGVMLYLHMGTARPALDSEPLIDRLNLRHRLLTATPDAQQLKHPQLTSERLNLIYNACDVGINTSEGEGWGLIAFEHGATGAAQIVPDHSACRELWQDSALLLPTVEVDRVEGYQRQGRTVTVSGIAHALEQLYNDRALYQRLSLAARRNACRPELAWQNIAQRWHEHFQSLTA